MPEVLAGITFRTGRTPSAAVIRTETPPWTFEGREDGIVHRLDEVFPALRQETLDDVFRRAPRPGRFDEVCFPEADLPAFPWDA